MSIPLLSVSDLHWHCQGKSILNNINFSVFSGQTLGIVGPNGAGKTSLLRCLYRMITPTQGRIRFQQQAITTFSSQELAKQIAVVNQHVDTQCALTVFQLVQLGLLPHKSAFVRFSTKDNATVCAAIDKVGLLNKQHDRFSTLSGGEQQRALIARALVQGAELLILDEPTNHLDVFYQHQVLQLVNDLNLTVVMTVHDLNLAARYCDSLLLLNNGELIKHGDIAQVLDESLLSRIFSMPCQVRQSPLSSHLQVDFYPHERGDNV